MKYECASNCMLYVLQSGGFSAILNNNLFDVVIMTMNVTINCLFKENKGGSACTLLTVIK